MLVAHYRIYSSLLVLRTCSIFGCQSWSWRGEMRIKLLLTDVLGSLALFALRCLQQVGERSSKRDFCREVQHTHTFLCPGDLPCSNSCLGNLYRPQCRASPPEPPPRTRGTEGCPYALLRCVQQLCSGDPFALWLSAEPAVQKQDVGKTMKEHSW